MSALMLIPEIVGVMNGVGLYERTKSALEA